ncbi:coiled-coil domain-containing protein 170-like isoform X2 [Ascaphus truei]|uniref:coiled-coil domain-containing protein 170-like isoform X2 n=1 Tax=Ascaphus truei TaxID=8439 RepID=UPI003F5A4E95
MSNPYGFLRHEDTASRIDRLFDNHPSQSRSQPTFRAPHQEEQENMYAKPFGKKEERSSTKMRHIPTYDYSDSLEEAKTPYDPAVGMLATRDQLMHYRRAAEAAHGDHAALLVKKNSLQAEVSDMKNRLAAKEAFLLEMKGELENYKENNARQASQIQSLKDHIKQLEQMSVSVNSVKAETSAGIYSFKRDNKELNERVQELEHRVRIHLIEREKAEQKASNLEKKLQESIGKLSSYLNMDIEEQEDPLNVLLTKVDKLTHEYFLEKSRIVSLEEALAGQQVEFKAGRETIVKLVSETEKQKKTTAGYATEVKALKRANEDLQQKVLKLTKQLDKQRDLYHEAVSKSYKDEETLQEHKESLKHLKGKLASEEMIKDGFNMDRKKLKKFLLQLAENLRMSRDISSESLPSQWEMLLDRAEAIGKMDKGYLSENKNLIYNLQKKVNSQREKLELQSSQIEQLQKKIKQLEKEKEQEHFLSAENSARLTAQKLQQKVDRLQGQLSDMKIANQNLTAKLVDINELKDRTLQQHKTVEELSRSLEKLDKIKEKAAKKVVSLKTELDFTEQQSRGETARFQHMVESLTNELHTAKRALEEVARREKQLVDFRETITRMMGFSINTLAVPDHEILDQLKQVLRTNGPLNIGRSDRSKLPYGFRTGDADQEYTVQHMNPFEKPRF